METGIKIKRTRPRKRIYKDDAVTQRMAEIWTALSDNKLCMKTRLKVIKRDAKAVTAERKRSAFRMEMRKAVLRPDLMSI